MVNAVNIVAVFVAAVVDAVNVVVVHVHNDVAVDVIFVSLRKTLLKFVSAWDAKKSKPTATSNSRPKNPTPTCCSRKRWMPHKDS